MELTDLLSDWVEWLESGVVLVVMTGAFVVLPVYGKVYGKGLDIILGEKEDISCYRSTTTGDCWRHGAECSDLAA